MSKFMYRNVEGTWPKDATDIAQSECNDLLCAVLFHKKCGDCGKFLKKSLWVPVDHSWKKKGLCGECLSNYNGQEF